MWNRVKGSTRRTLHNLQPTNVLMWHSPQPIMNQTTKKRAHSHSVKKHQSSLKPHWLEYWCIFAVTPPHLGEEQLYYVASHQLWSSFFIVNKLVASYAKTLFLWNSSFFSSFISPTMVRKHAKYATTTKSRKLANVAAQRHPPCWSVVASLI